MCPSFRFVVNLWGEKRQHTSSFHECGENIGPTTFPYVSWKQGLCVVIVLNKCTPQILLARTPQRQNVFFCHRHCTDGDLSSLLPAHTVRHTGNNNQNIPKLEGIKTRSFVCKFLREKKTNKINNEINNEKGTAGIVASGNVKRR